MSIRLAQVQPRLQPKVEDLWRDPITGMEFVWVPGDCYDMGCGSWTSDCDENEKNVHPVCVQKDKGFWMAKYEVTQGQWKKVSGGSNPSRFQKDDDYPVEKVSWNDVQDWIRKLNNQSGGPYRFRLPTEAEWEYACRSGGKSEKYAGGSDVGSVAWYKDNSGDSTHAVGSKVKNGLGIHDMSGNVWEWCEDNYSKEAYSKHQRDNPLYTEAGPDRVVRGGCWHSGPFRARCANRYGLSASDASYSLTVGLRLVRTP